MRYLQIIMFTFLTASVLSAQKNHYNVQKGYVAQGYDVVSYFGEKPEKGKDEYSYEYDGVNFKFHSSENLEKFQNDPTTYIPQYGGYCAYAIGVKGEKVSINPKTYEVRDGKLYLFYNRAFVNTLKKWKKEGPEKLKVEADKNWDKIISKN